MQLTHLALQQSRRWLARFVCADDPGVTTPITTAVDRMEMSKTTKRSGGGEDEE